MIFSKNFHQYKIFSSTNADRVESPAESLFPQHERYRKNAMNEAGTGHRVSKTGAWFATGIFQDLHLIFRGRSKFGVIPK